jgi:hypothetical protein
MFFFLIRTLTYISRYRLSLVWFFFGLTIFSSPCTSQYYLEIPYPAVFGKPEAGGACLHRSLYFDVSGIFVATSKRLNLASLSEQ